MGFTYEQYQKLISPASVVLAGVTSRLGQDSNNPLEMLLSSGYKGKIYAVNPHADEILGVKVHRSVLELPEIPDLAVICAPRDVVPAIFEDCARRGIKLVIIVAQGFTDGDAAGRELQKQISRLSRRESIRVLGPNTLGIVNNFASFSTSFMKFINRTGPVGILCQSGIFMTASEIFSGGIGIGIDTGNTSDLDFANMLPHLAADPRIGVINLHLEGMGDGRKFMAAAAAASRKKPVLALKTGRSKAGARAAGSHTGSLAGEDAVFDAALKQSGVIRVIDVEELSDYNRVFRTLPLMRGPRVGVVTITGGGGIIAVDACARYGLTIAEYSPQTMQVLKKFFPDWMEPGNPVDIWPASMLHGYGSIYRLVLETVLKDPGVDGVICITSAWTEGNFLDVSDIIAEAAGSASKPVTLWALGSRWQEYAAKLEKQDTLVVFPSANRAARSLAALYRQNLIQQREIPHQNYKLKNSTNLQVNPTYQPSLLNYGETMNLLKQYGIPVAGWSKAATGEQAVRAAEELGYPVALKIDGKGIAHKSDIGGVALNISTAEELLSAWKQMMSTVRAALPEAQIDGVIIQKHLSGGTEVLLGAKRDPQFGPVVLCGAGGIFTEIMSDTTMRIPPLTRNEILEMLQEIKLYQLLEGARGKPAADMEQLIGTITAFCRLIMEEPRIAEIDINPLLAGPHKIAALDARIYVY